MSLILLKIKIILKKKFIFCLEEGEFMLVILINFNGRIEINFRGIGKEKIEIFCFRGFRECLGVDFCVFLK